MATLQGPTILDVHTPSNSFAIIYSGRYTYITDNCGADIRVRLDTEDTLETLYGKLSKKASDELRGNPIRPGCVKFEWNGTVWNLDDGALRTPLLHWHLPDCARLESDFAIFGWRLKSSPPGSETAPVLFLRDVDQPLPPPYEYRNPSFYMFRPRPSPPSPQLPASPDSTSVRSSKSRKKAAKPADSTPKFKKEFEKFHNENGVRTILGSIGPVNEGAYLSFLFSPISPPGIGHAETGPAPAVRMLLKSGYRHVYISRKFAIKHGFIPRDAAPGHYGYGGLVK